MASAAGRPAALAMIALLAGIAPLAHADDASAPRQLVTLHNGDTISGSVTGFAMDGTFTLLSPDATAPILLKPAAVRMIDTLMPCVPLASSTVVIAFNDGDALPGNVIGFDGSSLTITSPALGGQTKVGWRDIARIDYNPQDGASVLAGALDSQPWKICKPHVAGTDKDAPPTMTWRIEHGCLIGKGPGGAAVDTTLPAKAEIDLDITSTNAMPLTIGLFTDAMLAAGDDAPDGARVIEKQGNPASPFLEGLALEISSQSVIARLHNHGQAIEHLGSKRLPPALRDKERRKLKIRVDTTKGCIGIWDNGKLMAKWTELLPFTLKGKSITLSHAAITSTLVLRRLEARAWLGTMDDDTLVPEPGKDVVVVQDGSRLTGKLGAFKDNLWRLHGGVGDLDIAGADVCFILRAGTAVPAAGVAAVDPTSLQVTLGSGHMLHLGDPALDASGVLRGSHATLGQITLPMTSVDTLVFPGPSPTATP